MSIKYYQLAKDEELPEEFCVIKDIGGEPSEYTFYAPEAENAKLRELVDGLTWCSKNSGWCRQECPLYDVSEPDHCREVSIKREVGIEV